MKHPTKQTSRHVKAVLSALAILDCFETEPTLSVKQIVDITGFTRNRVMRLSGTLEKRGYLTQHPDSKKFSLGLQTMVLGKAFERNNNYVSIVRPILRQLAKNTGESATLFVQNGSDRLVLVREEGTQDIRYLVAEGQRLALHAGAGGKVLLAFGPESIKRKILSNKRLPAVTPHTITDPKELEAELAKVRSTGHAFSEAEATLDAASIAAPVFNYENKLVGALSIAGPITRFTKIKQIDYLKQVLETSNTLSMRLGWNQINNMLKNGEKLNHSTQKK